MNYDDIINLPHHVSERHPHMPVSDRAAQFAPFAALTGYGDVIRETARLTEARPELSEDERAEMDQTLRAVLNTQGKNAEIVVTYFAPDARKSGGAYRRAAGNSSPVCVPGDGTGAEFYRMAGKRDHPGEVPHHGEGGRDRLV